MIVIEAFDPTPRKGGPYHGFPVSGVVEEDGIRHLLTELPCPVGLWQRAVGIRASAIVGDWGSFDGDVSMLVRDGNILEPQMVPERKVATRPFVHIHAHSHYSALDGYSTIDEMVETVVEDGQEYLAVTDHGTCAAHLEMQQKCAAAGIKALLGIEANLVADARDHDPSRRYDYWHFILIAKNEVGLANLWRASSMAHLPENFYGRPRMDWRILEECSEGLVASTACLRGPLSSDLLEERDDEALHKLARLRKLFGDDLFLELHANQLPQQRVLNERLISLGNEQGIPFIAVSDSHYACASDKDAHKVWMSVQTDKTLQDEADLFAENQDYHLHSSDEAYEALRYLGDDIAASAIANTVEIAKSCDATITPRPRTPVYHRHDQPRPDNLKGIDLDDYVLEQLCREAMSERLPDEIAWNDELSEIYHQRFEYELDQIRSKRFSGYHLIVWDYTRWCRDKGILLGPARGSSAGSIVCYLLGITQVDPIQAGTLFERYISPGRTSLPDIDSDFPASRRPDVTEYIFDRWGGDHVVRVGTVTKTKNKGVFKDVARTLKGSPFEVEFTDSEKISKIIDLAEIHTSGLGLKWDELMDEAEEELAPFREKYPVLFEYAERLVGRVRQYGKHPAGLVIDTMEPISGRLPMRQGDDDYPVTEFPMEMLDFLGLVKFDILTLRTLDTIQMALDLLNADPAYAGKIPHPHTWRAEYDDPEVWDMICDGDVLGVFQLETPAGARMNDRIKPRSLADLAAVVSLNRPGPMRSGLADSYIARRDGKEQVSYPHPDLENALRDTFGTFIYQEQLMRVTQIIGGYDGAEADEVRSILGKKKIDKIAAEGKRFVVRSVENGYSQELAERLFEQMKEFARYSFNLSHAYSYAILGFWCAWFKCHFPLHFYVACLSTVDKGRIPEFVMEVRRKGYRIDLPDVNESDEVFSVSRDKLGVRYGLSSIMNFGGVAARAVIDNRVHGEHERYVSFDDFVEHRGKKCNWGDIKTLAFIGALDSLIPEGSHRAQLEDVVEQMSTGKLERCVHLRPHTAPSMGVDACCGFDWLSEPPRLGKSGKPLKPKPIPKACTRACRQYTATSAIEWRDVTELTQLQIRRRERDVLGLYVSSTPFDGLNIDASLQSFDELQEMEGGYAFVLAELTSRRLREDKYGRKMAFVTLMLQDGTVDAVVFDKAFKKIGSSLIIDAFGIFLLFKNDRGFQLDKYIPIIQR